MNINELFEGMSLKKTVWSRTAGQLRKKEIDVIALPRRTWIETKPEDSKNAS